MDVDVEVFPVVVWKLIVLASDLHAGSCRVHLVKSLQELLPSGLAVQVNGLLSFPRRLVDRTQDTIPVARGDELAGERRLGLASQGRVEDVLALDGGGEAERVLDIRRTEDAKEAVGGAVAGNLTDLCDC